MDAESLISGVNAQKTMNTQLSLSFDEQPIKRCPECKRILSLDCFCKDKSMKDGLHCYCKKCVNQRNKEYHQNNKEEICRRQKKYQQNNKKAIAKRKKKYRQEHKEEEAKKRRLYQQSHKKERSRYVRKRRKEDPKFRLNQNVRSAIFQSLKTRNILKNRRPWESLVNFTLEELKSHLENLFQDGMTWENQGEWHLDHRKPVSLFDFQSVEDPGFKECWALENL